MPTWRGPRSFDWCRGTAATQEDDESLARRLQAEEEAALATASAVHRAPTPFASAAARSGLIASWRSPWEVVPAQGRSQQVSDAELARWLQENNAQQRPPRMPTRHQYVVPGIPILPEDLAGFVPLNASDAHGTEPPHTDRLRWLFTNSASNVGGRHLTDTRCWPMLGSFVESGAFLGCCVGFQVAGLLHLGQAATWLCSVGGTVTGHIAVRGPAALLPARLLEDSDSDYGEGEIAEEQRGLDHSAIEDHTVGHTFIPCQRPGASSNEDNKCMICMENFVAGEELRSLPCLHRYHRACIDEWLSRSKACPICKQDITAAPSTPVSARHSQLGGGRVAALLNSGWLRRRQ